MNKAELYVEGARLPEHLSRLIFLESMIAGRRVLEVGSRSPAVARFLLELGATRVVCVVDDRVLLERLRDDNDLERVDYRSVRPTGGSRPPGFTQAPVLPGDDGAFDLVIDFSLPEALAAGQTERLTDIQRLLSPDGFAITALPTAPSGLAGLLPSDRAEPRRVGYRVIADALRGNFGLVQVYFQSLMLGYLFGSFDHEPDGSGIAPQTTLMGDEPEPAGAYVFAFGNAIPVIEDVCLVQMPFDALMEAVLRRRSEHAATIPATATAPLGTADFGESTELGSLPVDAEDPLILAGLLRVREGRIAELELALRDTQRPPAAVAGASYNDDDDDDDDDDARLTVEFANAIGRVTALEQVVALREAEIMRANAARDDLRFERDLLAEKVVSNDGARTSLEFQVRELASEFGISKLRIEELEDLAVSLDGQRFNALAEVLDLKTINEGERLRTNAQREMLEAAVAEHETLINDLHVALQGTGIDLHSLRDIGSGEVHHTTARVAVSSEQDETSTVASRLRASLEQRFAAAEERAQQAASLVDVLSDRLAEAEASRDATYARLAELTAAAAADADNAADIEATAAALAESAAACEALDARLRDSELRQAKRTTEAVTLANAVTTLVEERSGLRRHVEDASHQREAANARATVAENRLHGQLTEVQALELEVTSLREELRSAADSHDDALARTIESQAQERRQHEERRRLDQRQLEETRRQLNEARDEQQELVSQRMVLQQALAAREKALTAVDHEMATVRTELERVTSLTMALQRREADLMSAAEAMSLEVQRLHSVADESAQRTLSIRRERDALAEQLASAVALQAAAEQETERFLELVEETEAGAARERASWRAAHHAEITALRDELLAASARATDAEQVLTRNLEASRQAADDAEVSRATLERDHAATRDELAELTTALLDLEAQFVAERTAVRGQIDVGNAALDAARRHVTELSAALTTMTADLVLRDAELASSQQQSIATTAQLGVVHADLLQLQQELQDSRGKHTELAATLMTDRSAVAGEQAARDAASQRQAYEFAVLSEQLAAEIAANLQAVTASDAERASLRNAVETLNQSLADAESQLEQRRSLIDTLTLTLTSKEAALTSARADLQGATDLITRLGGERDALRAMCDRLTDTLTGVTTEVTTTTSTLAELRLQHDAESAAHTLVVRALEARLEAATDEEHLQSERVAALNDRLAGANADRHRLESHVETLKTAHHELTGLLSESGREVEAQHATIVTIDADRVRLASTLAALSSAHDELTAVNVASEAARVELTTDLLASRERLDDANADVTRLSTELRDRDDTLIRVTADGVDVAAQLGRAQADLIVVNDARARLDNDANALLEQLHIEEDRANALSTTLSNMTEQLAKSERLTEELTSNHTLIVDEQRALQQRLDDAVSDVKRLTSAHYVVCAQGEALQARLSLIEGELERLGKERDDAVEATVSCAADFGEQLGHVSEQLHKLVIERDDINRQLVRADEDLRANAASYDLLVAERSVLGDAVQEARGLLETARDRGELLAAALQESADAASNEKARGDLLAAHLDEAREAARRLQQALDQQASHDSDAVDQLTATVAQLSADADADRSRAELLAALLDEAHLTGTRLLARAGELSAIVVELQQLTGYERSRGDTLAALLDEAQHRLIHERARGDTFAAQLEDLQIIAAVAQARGDGLSAVVDEARSGWSLLAAQEQQTRAVLDLTKQELVSRHMDSSAAQALQSELQAERESLATLRMALADALALNDSRASELAGLRDALMTAREDGADTVASLNEERRELSSTVTRLQDDRHALSAALRERSAALERLQAGAASTADDLNADLESATAQRDAAVAAVDSAREAVRAEVARCRAIEDELAGVRLELERVIAQGVGARSSTEAMLRASVQDAEAALRLRDEKIAEQADRINRLTERIVRSEGLG